MSCENSRAQMMEERELEEGEACYYKDNDTSIDPDIALSYIDEKLQSVLGHFQKDFEGGVSAENLGAKFGGYGSFLPTYHRSPSVLSQPRTPQRSQNQGASRSPNHLASEGPSQNSTAVSNPPSTWRNGTAGSRSGHTLHDSKVPCGDDSTRQGSCFSAQECNKFPAKHEVSMIKSLNPTDQRTFKLRIRVGSDKTAQKSTSLHTSLGLISPSSSMENSPTESGEMLSKFQEIHSDSPASILQTMTSFPVAGNMLLSPLHEKLLTLSRKGSFFAENEHVAAAKDANPQSVMSANNSTSRLEDGDVLIRKKTKSVGKSEYAEELNSEVRNGMISLFQKNVGIEILDNRHCFSNDLNQRVVPDLVCDTHESVKGANAEPEAIQDSEKEVLMKKREINRLKDQLFGSDLDKDDSLESLSDVSGDNYYPHEVRSRSVELQLKSFQKNASFDSKEGGRSKCSRSVPSFRAGSNISESERDCGAVSLRKKVVMKAASHKTDQPRIPYSENQSSEGKKKLTEHQPGLKPAADVAEVRGFSPTLKNKKSSKKDVRVAHVFDAQLEKPTNQLDSLGRPPGDKLKKSKLEARKAQHSSSAKLRQVPSKKVDSHVACATPMKDPSAVGIHGAKELTSGAEPPVAPVVIEEDWVGCDKCQKWRLLPYGTKPEQLPERWLCSMLNWLPGMNRCDISEEETTRALHALYQMPLPDNLNSLQNHADRSVAGVISADMHGLGGNSQNAGLDYIANGRKKKHKLRETPNTNSNHGPMLTTNSNLQHELVQSRSLKNVNQPIVESNLISKSNAQIPVKSSDVCGKHLNKPKECMANGDEKPKKKSKRESDQYDHWYLKKLKIKSDQAFVTTREVVTGIQDYHERGNLKETKPGLTERLQILEKKHENQLQDSRDSGLINVKTNIGREISVKKRKLRDQNYLMNSLGNCNHLGDSDGDAIAREVNGESGFRKQKKSKVFHSEKKDSSTSKGEEKSRTRGTITRIVLPGTRDFPIDRSVEREHQTKKYRVKVQSRLTMEDIDSLKKDLGCEQLSMAATSSSSKVSDSRKRRVNHQVKGSPIGSVSSSPMRIFIPSKASPARMGSSGKDEAKLDDVGNPRKYLDGDYESDKSRTLIKGKRPGVPHPEFYENSVLDLQGTDAWEKFESCVVHSSEFGNSHMDNSKVDVLEECSPYMTEKHAAYFSDGKGRVSKKHVSMLNEHKSAKDSPMQFKEKGWNTGFNNQRVEENISDQLGSKEVLNSKIDHNYLDSSTKSFKNNQKVSKKDPTHCSESRREHRLKHDGVGSTTKLNNVCDMEGKKQKPHQEIDAQIATNSRSTQTESRDLRSQVGAHAEDKLGTSVIKSKPASGSQKGSFKDVGTTNTSVSARLSTMLKDPGVDVCQSVSHNSMGHLELDHCAVQEPSAPTPSKREASSQTALIVLREAEDLRDVADRLKNSGFHAEYNQAYFQAALKFLQGASLLESSNGESSKSVEMNQIQIYSITAKLCETCALEYEKHDEAATASLAYKCMEVAYMRVVYCKNMSSSRIWHDLQASLQVPPQGESPSSSASDVDNTNNQTVEEKTALSRGSGSHAGNHVIAPRYRPSFVRLLDFTKDVNSAMEASRKAQNAFAAATNVEEAENKDTIISIKRVIDFSFQDVEELIRLVKLAIEAINHNGFGGSRA